MPLIRVLIRCASPNSFLDEIRARLPVSDVVRRRVQLKKQGREWRGLSPFNKERTPSFYVNDQKGFYHDFSSGKHGDIFGFVMETEGLPFPEAVERLANIAGVPMPVASPDEAAREAQRRTLHEVMELAASFFEDETCCLRRSKSTWLSGGPQCLARDTNGISNRIRSSRPLCTEGIFGIPRRICSPNDRGWSLNSRR